jgi:hypothetical protein
MSSARNALTADERWAQTAISQGLAPPTAAAGSSPYVPAGARLDRARLALDGLVRLEMRAQNSAYLCDDQKSSVS